MTAFDPNITRRSVIGAGLAGTGLLALGACGGRDTSRPKRGGMIRIATHSASTSDTLDPGKGGTALDYIRHFMLYNGLTCIEDGSLKAELSLASAFESADLITWQIELKRGILFHDGSELTAKDVVFSLLRHKDPSVGSKMSTLAEQFADVRSDGRYGVVVRLIAPNADLATLLATPHMLIVKAGQTRPDGNGTGPFRLVDFRPGVRTELSRNDEYWIPDSPKLDRIELIAIPDEVSRVNALLSGDVQMINAMNPRSVRRVEASPDYRAMVTPSSLYTNLVLSLIHI